MTRNQEQPHAVIETAIDATQHGPKHLLLLAAIGNAFLQDADMYNDEDVTNFFDEVVVPMREAAKEALRPQAVVGPTNASSLQCSADQLTVRILEADRKLDCRGGPAASPRLCRPADLNR